MQKYDFAGYVTRNDIRCADGHTIRRGAFSAQDGKTVPLVWNHDHKEMQNVLGHVLLENREDGVYGYGSFNDSAEAQDAKIRIKHGDINGMSIYANGLRQTRAKDVMHGVIREVSLVLAGANPGAFIEATDIYHSEDDINEDTEFDAVIYSGDEITLEHSEGSVPEKEELEHSQKDTETKEPESKNDKSTDKEETGMADAKKERTVGDVVNEFTEEQKKVVAYLIQQALEEAEKDNSDDDDEAKQSYEETDKEEYIMHNNVFENAAKEEFRAKAEDFLAHSEDVFKDAQHANSLKDVVIAHAAEYGIDNINYLFPDARALQDRPDFIKRDDSYVTRFLGRVRKTPFSRIKTIHADLTEQEARAKGYADSKKGTKKMDEVFTLLKRQTGPTTIYKHQKFDRKDVVDITDFDVIIWVKQEMRMMLDEEIVIAALIGDGRPASAADKIDPQCIRPIWTDDDLYTIKATVELTTGYTEKTKAKETIRTIIKERAKFKGTGSPIFFVSQDALTEMLLLEDDMGRDLYDDISKLATKLRVSEIIPVDMFANKTRTPSEGADAGTTYNLIGIIVNPADYTIGTDKGGEVSLFEDFDIDYNQQKYLIETICSGAMTKPKAAMAVEYTVSNS